MTRITLVMCLNHGYQTRELTHQLV